MKKLQLIILYIFTSTLIFSQSPSKFSYQAVVRNVENNLVTNSVIGIRLNIIKDTITGPVVYEEIHTPETNINGLFSIEVGGETGFDTISWENGPYFLRSEIDPEGGTNYTIIGTTQLLSVPYALHAQSAESLKGGHYVGELFGGGIIFGVTPDRAHGLIASLDDLDDGNGATWGLYGINIPNCESMTDGEANTTAIINAGANPSEAAGLCHHYSGGGYTDWYLPSKRELELLISNDILIDKILDNDGDPNTNGFTQDNINALDLNIYWSSTEYNSSWAIISEFRDEHAFYQNKTNPYRVRAIRAF